MSNPYVGEIRIFAGNFAPQSWAFCDGSTVSISDYDTLFNLIGTTYGGDGVNTFALPDLRGRVPVHQGAGFTLGQLGGAESVTLTTQQLPSHGHSVGATGTGQTTAPNGAYFAVESSGSGSKTYSTAAPTTALALGSVSIAGGSQPHDNIQPSLGISYIISLFGVFPSQN